MLSFNSEEVREKLSAFSCFLFIYLFFIWKINSLDGLAGSTILSTLDSKYLDQLNSYLDPVRQTTGRSRFVRCWHAKTDGWVAATFHSNCDGKGPTVTIVQVGSYIFGGYTDKSWGGMYHFVNALIAHICSALSCGRGRKRF